MSNSSLVSYKKISPHKNVHRNHKIDTITIHCYVGQASVESMGSWFSNPNAEASCNYGIGTDGRIALIVDEEDRSWCSSSSSNDNRAITIECASDNKPPYAINDKVYSSLISLCEDICRRNGIKELKWRGDKSLIGNIEKQNMTVHRWFKNKDCPGEYIYSRLGQIAAQVNERLGSDSTGDSDGGSSTSYPETPFEVQVLIDDLNYRSDHSMDGEVKGQTGKGLFTITRVVNGWGELKSGAGWIWLGNASYCRILSTIKPPETETFSVKITASALNVRTGPGLDYDVVMTVGKNEIYTIVNTINGWGELKSGAGWISLDYTKSI